MRMKRAEGRVVQMRNQPHATGEAARERAVLSAGDGDAGYGPRDPSASGRDDHEGTDQPV
jgi:hypothetical protein